MDPAATVISSPPASCVSGEPAAGKTIAVPKIVAVTPLSATDIVVLSEFDEAEFCVLPEIEFPLDALVADEEPAVAM